MTATSATPHVALGAALHFDHVLADDPRPFEGLVHALVADVPVDQLRTFHVPDSKHKAPPPERFDLHKLIERVRSGATWLASVSTAPGTPDADQLEIAAGTVGADRPARSLTRCRYALKVAIGPAPLAKLGAARALDPIIAFADAVAARAGVVQWAPSTTYASCLASGGASTQLTREQNSHIGDLLYWQPRWGDAIRGPQWGTFLGASHVEALGGIDAIARGSQCARAVPLRSGGAFLQATSLDAPIVEDTDDGGVLARLASYLAPVMGQRA